MRCPKILPVIRTTLCLLILLNGVHAYPVDTTALIPYRIGNKWGFSDIQGKIKIQPRFGEVREFVGGYAAVRLGYWGIIDRSGKITCQPKYDWIGLYRDSGRGVIAYADRLNQSYTLDMTGKVLSANTLMEIAVTNGTYPPALEEPRISTTFKKLPDTIDYHHRSFYICPSPKKPEKLCVKNGSGGYLFPQDFSHVRFSCVGTDTIILAEDDGRKYVFDMAGHTILSRDYAKVFTNGSHLFQRVRGVSGISIQIYTTRGRQLFETFNGDVEFIKDDSSLVIVKLEKSVGDLYRTALIDLDQERYIIKPLPVKISPDYHLDNRFIISYRDTGKRQSEKIRIVDSALNPLSQPFDRIMLPKTKSHQRMNIFIGSAGYKMSVFDFNGKQLLPWFKDMNFFGDSLFLFVPLTETHPYRHGIITLGGRQMVPAYYTDIYGPDDRRPHSIEHLGSSPSNHLFEVQNREFYGVVDTSGKELLEPIYRDVILYANYPIAWVKTQNGQTGYINLQTGLRYFRTKP